ncbi:MAG: 4Fe-4S dicluster domain-containing protein [bacterium]
MTDTATTTTTATALLQRSDFPRLLDALAHRGFTLVGPTVHDAAIVYSEIAAVDDLPAGWTDEQSGGTYRLKKRNDAALFGYVVGPQSWKKYFHPPFVKLWEIQRKGRDMQYVEEEEEAPKLALIGARSCEIQAIAIQDKVFMGGPYTDSHYQLRRKNTFVVAVNCTQPGGTCFCASMDTGPRARAGFDLALTEVIDDRGHRFVVETGTDAGREVLADIPHKPASESDLAGVRDTMNTSTSGMGRTMETKGLKDLLYKNLEHPRWNQVADRCLSCANCTMVCPTCFCTTVEDLTDLAGGGAQRRRKWDSCFSMDFTYIHGGHVRRTTQSRYRQWMTHKLATWIDQFGTSGCVGCGRCITWCPVGIDITEEVKAIRESKT